MRKIACATYEERRRKNRKRLASERLRDRKRKNEPKRRASERLRDRKRDRKRNHEPRRLASKKKYDRKNSSRHAVAARAEEARASNTYEANSHIFASYAAAAMAHKVAAHVNISKQDILENEEQMRPLTDEQILAIKKRWDAHQKSGCNKQVCATCGIIGLSNPSEFDLTHRGVKAFKVAPSRTVCVFFCLRGW